MYLFRPGSEYSSYTSEEEEPEPPKPVKKAEPPKKSTASPSVQKAAVPPMKGKSKETSIEDLFNSELGEVFRLKSKVYQRLPRVPRQQRKMLHHPWMIFLET